MTDQVKGVIEAVKDDGGSKGKFGWQHKLGINVDGDWYGGWTKKSAEDQGIEEGAMISFSYSENGDYKNFDAKTIKVSKAAPEASGGGAPARAAAVAVASKINGASVGMAINNAVQLVVSGKANALDGEGVAALIERLARGILAISQRIESGQPQAAVKPIPKPAPAAVQEQAEEEEEEEAPAPKPKAKPPVKTAAAPAKPGPKPKPKAAPEPEPESEGPDFDDDIPF